MLQVPLDVSQSEFIIGNTSGYASTGGMLQVPLNLSQSQSIIGSNLG